MPQTHTAEIPYTQLSQHYFEAIRHRDWPIWLDSGKPEQARGRFDIMTASPSLTLSHDNNGFYREQQGERSYLRVDELWCFIESYLQQVVDDSHPARKSPLPFSGGWLGSFGYDLGRQLEALSNTITEDQGVPAIQLGFYDWALIQDHQERRTWLTALSAEKLMNIDRELQAKLGHTYLEPMAPSLKPSFQVGTFISNTSKGAYLNKVKRIKDYIEAGDCYQANFAQRFSASACGDAFTGYLSLRSAMPAHYSCYFETPAGCILSHSPERFLSVDNGHVLTQPIKGTAARHLDPELDAQAALTLSSSAKDRAENLMIVDLLRNDLSKVSQPNSVKVPQLFSLESYRNVHHLVSNITSRLTSNSTCTQLLKACFPGGSITGAPKKRAMEIIEELEDARRNQYCGSIGYLSLNGKMDSSISIRTLVFSAGEVHCWGGGGIVDDSEPEQEYQESLDKVQLLLDTLSGASPAQQKKE